MCDNSQLSRWQPVNISCEEEINTNTTVSSTPGTKCNEAPEVTSVTDIQNNDEDTATQPQPAKRLRKIQHRGIRIFYWNLWDPH